jgi:hypothetical protein
LEVAVAECTKLKTCPFFGDRLGDVPAVATLLKQRYCLGDFARCARYRVATPGLPVPDDLFPNQGDRADRILQGR